MKNSRPLIKFAQIPHSITRLIESLSNPTATALLSLLTRKTVGFGQGFVDLSYRQISKTLGVDPRTITRSAKILENIGAILRERAAGGSYRWRIILQQEEVLKDLNHTYTVSSPPQGGDRIDLSEGIRSICQDPQDRSIRTSTPLLEQARPTEIRTFTPSFEQKKPALNNMFKEHELKKQQQSEPTQLPPTETKSLACSPNSLDTKTDDEPFHKICLKGLRQHGVSQRIARKLCNDHNHELILSVLKTAPQRPGIQNLAAYIVSEIQDGGYEQAPAPMRPLQYKKDDGHQETGDRHPSVDAPITYRTPEQTQQELQKMEAERLYQEQTYQEQGRILGKRFRALAEEVKLHLKLLASIQLTHDLPKTGNREQMLKDKTFQRLANRTVLQRFFDWVDEGMDSVQALKRLERAFSRT